MKTSLNLLALAVLIVLSSCGTSGIAVIKRKYNSGYCVDFGSRKNTTSSKSSSIEKNETNAVIASDLKKEALPESTVTDVEDQEADYPLTAGNDEGIYIAPNETKGFNSVKPESSASTTKKEETKKQAKVTKKLAGLLKNKMNKSKGKNVSDETILLVILSLFPILALIAIYIKDGQSITTNFWIDLILHFVFLYWLFALLVVLDVINLA